MKRRNFIQTLGAGAVASAFGEEAISKLSQAKVPIRQITKGPLNHWFGYYDKLEFDPTNRLVLSNQVDFEHRTPTGEDITGVAFRLHRADSLVEIPGVGGGPVNDALLVKVMDQVRMAGISNVAIATEDQ